MKPQFIGYSKCSTCTKASKWLEDNNIEFETRDIITQNPTVSELTEWIAKSGLPITKFFNTSGIRYKELGLKNIVKDAPNEELIKLLASEGMLVKRPLLILDKIVLVGFKPVEYEQISNL